MLSRPKKNKAMEIFEAKSAMEIKRLGDPFLGVTIVMHQNGQVDGCGFIAPSNLTLKCKLKELISAC